MAGRPVNLEQREARKREVDAAIKVIKRRQRPVTRRAIADEIGISVQSLYGSGYLSLYINELDAAGLIEKERGNPTSLTDAEVKKLTQTVSKLQNEVKKLKKKVSEQAKELLSKDTEIAALQGELQIERGKNFLKEKRDFAQRHI